MGGERRARKAGRFAGEYSGYLGNGGEQLRIEDVQNEKILDFDYNDAWYPSTDGDGLSLVVVDETATFNTWGKSANWQPSLTENGSPGADD